jgi:NAD(P)-dependent dehydrogenase (short-subunit alcohol dehydrogenase family)
MRPYALLIAAFLVPPILHAQSAPAAAPSTQATRAVLVTGASTGIGRKITEHLAAKGYWVYAGARKQADLDSLAALRNVQALRLDVTRQEDIDAALASISKAGRGLYALVNNAGIATLGSVSETSMQEFDLLMQVNVYGPYRMTKAFTPLILESKGRITTISSISGILAGRNFSAYSMSKHAMEAFGDALAAELEPLGVRVSLIEPGNYDSQIGKSVGVRTGMTDNRLADRSRYKKPDEVAAAVELALFEENPRRRYLVVPEQREAELTVRKQIEQLVQLNEGHAYSYDRETLVRMLDEALAQARPRTPAQP